MAETPFAQLTIAARKDLESTLASLDLIAQEGDEAKQSARVQNAYNDAKSELLTDLLQVAPDIFAYSLTVYAGMGVFTYDTWTDWFFAMGYNWDTVDGLMDAIFNPQVLKDTFVACWKWKLYSVQAEDMLSSDNFKSYISMRDYWEEQYHLRYDKAWRLLSFDINGDGTIQPGERLRTRNVIRVR